MQWILRKKNRKDKWGIVVEHFPFPISEWRTKYLIVNILTLITFIPTRSFGRCVCIPFKLKILVNGRIASEAHPFLLMLPTTDRIWTGLLVPAGGSHDSLGTGFRNVLAYQPNTRLFQFKLLWQLYGCSQTTCACGVCAPHQGCAHAIFTVGSEVCGFDCDMKTTGH